ncbi:MAG: DNA translocase FtsK 4TM domain-containing protein [Alphaproteobacteria bacterium]|jgi:S-DNA-T family DNA segregation ATPase FtsK/SpoIIIE|nr:DNA translocase FtsK 4TM domain-containing protein [Alphaproteobacteria bacterium]
MSSRPLVRSGARYRNTRSSWLPDPFKEGLIRVFARVQGGSIILFALLLALAMLSYTPTDPSSNTASSENVRNLLGLTGAGVADFVWQYFGIAGFLIPIILAAWGWLVGTQRGLDLLGGRTVAALCAIISAGVAIVALDPAATLDSTKFWGGAFAHLLAISFLSWLPKAFGVPLLALTMGLLALMTLYMAAALTINEWQNVVIHIHAFFHALTRTALSTLHRMWNFVRYRRNYDDELYEQNEAEDDIEEEEAEEEDEEETEENVESTAKRGFGFAAFARKKKKAPLVFRPTATTRQTRLPLSTEDSHTLPPLELLQWPETGDRDGPDLSEEALEKNAKVLENVLAEFGVHGQITKVSPGPVVTLYELEPAPGTRSSRIISLADDIARNMSAASVRVAVVQGRNVIGIELPNKKREMVYLRELLCSDVYTEHKGAIPLVLGKDIAGMPVVTDLVRMPHLLIAGTTGSGKSVAINTMILSLLYRLPPQKCRFIMIDPKMLELSVYEGIPHLLAPVVTDPKKAITALKWTVREMEERYRAMSKLGVRNIDGYNLRLREAAKNEENLTRTIQTGFDRETGKPIYEEQPLDLTPLPYIVVIVDEMADLMIVAGKEIESAVQRLAQMARAAGIHILMATQRPSVDVITGTIKANFPTRISFQVTSKIDSRTILGEQGAEQLLGFGDMLFMAGGGRISRVHGPFVSDREVEEVVKFLKTQGEPEYLNEVTEDEDENGPDDFIGGNGGGSESNDLYDKAVDLVLREQKASISFVQRHLSIGYNRAATLIERMEKDGIIGEANHVGKREVYGRRPDDD